MIYGDTPRKITEREAALGLKTYTYAPQITAVMQSGNLYVYEIGNPVMYADENGQVAVLTSILICTAVGSVVSGLFQVGRNIHSGNDWTQGLAVAMLAGASVEGYRRFQSPDLGQRSLQLSWAELEILFQTG